MRIPNDIYNIIIEYLPYKNILKLRKKLNNELKQQFRLYGVFEWNIMNIDYGVNMIDEDFYDIFGDLYINEILEFNPSFFLSYV